MISASFSHDFLSDSLSPTCLCFEEMGTLSTKELSRRACLLNNHLLEKGSVSMNVSYAETNYSKTKFDGKEKQLNNLSDRIICSFLP